MEWELGQGQDVPAGAVDPRVTVRNWCECPPAGISSGSGAGSQSQALKRDC